MSRNVLRATAAQTMLFDCSRYQTFVVRLITGIQNMWFTNIVPGMLYVFVFKQDHHGHHSVNWGNLARPQPVDAQPESITVATFVGTVGYLQWVAPTSWIRGGRDDEP